ncbi:hypothetical protein OHV05_38000 (plasmid) [Kitasatospora sp. NBC_00070]|uniref:hypothetical protein n=1 Tax=Kitasatospora sp. NBC_00070 TaxID=2975962 RepID=UPI003251092A
MHVFLSDAAEEALAALRPDELDVVEKLVGRLAAHPRLGIPVPGGAVPGVDDYTAPSAPSAGGKRRVSLVYRVNDGAGAVFVTWIVAGP